MGRGLVLVSAGLLTVGCASRADAPAAVESEVTAGVSPLDDVTYDFDLDLASGPDNGCPYHVIFGIEPEGREREATVLGANGRTVTGQLRLQRYARLVSVKAVQYCAHDHLARPGGGYSGRSEIDPASVKTTLGPMARVSLLPDGGTPAATSLAIGVRLVEKARPVKDTNCAQTASGSAHRFFVSASTFIDYGREGEPRPLGWDYERTITLDGDRFTIDDKPYDAEFFTYCRPKSEGRPDEVHVKVDLFEDDVFDDDRFDSGSGIAVPVGTRGEIIHTHRATGFEQPTKVMVLR